MLHLALVTLLGYLIPLPNAVLALLCAGAVMYVLGLLRLGLVLGLRPWLSVAGALVGALSGFAPFNLLNGLETGLAMAGVAWALVFAIRPPRPWALPALCGLLPFLRPELGLLSLLLMAREAWLRRLPPLRVWLAPMVLAGLPFLLWTWWNTGHLLPSTIMAKAYFYAQIQAPLAAKLQMAGNALSGSLLFTCLLGFLLLPRDSLAACASVFALAFLVCYAWILPAALDMNGNRYPMLLLPLSTFMLMTAAARGRFGRYLLLAVAAFALCTAPFVAVAYVQQKTASIRELAALSHWLDQELPDDARLLIHDAGYLAYAGHRNMTDLVGLKTPSSVSYHRLYTRASGGDRRKALSLIAGCAGATHAVLLQNPQRSWSPIAPELESQGWQLTLLRPAPSGSGYLVYAMRPPSAGFSGACQP
ncbi:hypothetical protein ACHMW6_03500 [Pseudoduganella sp. UC29_106]|uniref:hypothetical protein n=1 Tax=Pseudoduganella sp. UC29_106 TaxID=3374553 RepID=UPI0037569E99